MVTAALTRGASVNRSSKSCGESNEVKTLVAARNMEADESVKKELSKRIWRALRRQRRQAQNQTFAKLAADGMGLRHLRRVLDKHQGVQYISCIEARDGNAQHAPSAICEVFATFYEDLYRDAEWKSIVMETNHADVQTISVEEVSNALKRLKNNRTGAEDGLVAEMLKTGHGGLLTAIAEFFNQLLLGQVCTPDVGARV